MQTERIPPQNLEAERSVLGCVMLSRNALDDLEGSLRAEDFYADAHEQIFRVAQSLHEAGKPVDAVTMASALGDKLAEVGGPEYLGRILETVPHAAHVNYYAGLVIAASRRRQLIDAATEAIEAASTNQETSEIVAQAESRLHEILEADAGRKVSASMTDLLEEVIANLDSNEPPGLALGWDDLDAIYQAQPGHLIIVAGRPSMGKAQPIDEPVLTPSGWRKIGDMCPGDYVIGANGKPARILATAEQGCREVFTVRFTDGGSTRTCAEHLWVTRNRSERRRGLPGSIRQLSEIMATIRRSDGGGRNHSIPYCKPVEFGEMNKPPLDPWLVGVYLGDGDYHSGSVRISNPERDIRDRLARCLPSTDTVVEASEQKLRIKRKQRNNRVSGTAKALKNLGLYDLNSHEKFIPDIYLKSSVSDRLALLQGLCDTDGYVTPAGRCVEYSTSSPKLAEGIRFLVGSLGGWSSCKQKKPHFRDSRGRRKSGRISFRINLGIPSGLIPISTKKHLAQWKDGDRRTTERFIDSVEPSGMSPCRCITVEASDGLYVTRDFAVTHNSALAAGAAINIGKRGLRTLFFSLEQTRIELTERLLASWSRVPGNRINRMEPLEEGDRDLILRASGTLSDLPIDIDDDTDATVSRISAKARVWKRRHGLDLLVVDYLQLVEPEETKSNREQQVAVMSRRLKKLAVGLEVPVMCLAQLNRQSENRPDKRPRLSDLRESGSIEQDANCVVFVHRPEEYNPTDRPGEAELIVAKNRNGEKGTVKLQFEKSTVTFRNLAKGLDYYGRSDF